MDYSTLINILSQYELLDASEQALVKKTFQPITAAANYSFKRTFDESVFFVGKGILRAFYQTPKGWEITRMIAAEGRFLRVIPPYQGSSLSEEIQCLQEGEFLVANKEEFSEMIIRSPKIQRIYTRILEEYHQLHIHHLQVMHTATVAEKMRYLKSNYPKLNAQLSDSILSSFLGMSRESFQRNKSLLF